MPVGIVDISVEIYDLLMIIMGVCAVIGVMTFGMMI